MASSSSASLSAIVVLIALSFSSATRSLPPTFLRAPPFASRGPHCRSSPVVHIAMTLDSNYLRGTFAAVFSLLNHSSCPHHLHFHFLHSSTPSPSLLLSVFPSLRFSLHPFLHHRSVSSLVSSSLRPALQNPLNYARNYLPDLLPPSLPRVIYLDSDVVATDDIASLWTSASLSSHAVLAAPEYCHVDISRYFNRRMDRVFRTRRRSPCYFNTGVMVIDLAKWRDGGYSRRIERWMEVQKEHRIYELGSLPPLLLVFAGNVEPVDHRWNQHGLGGDNASGECREVHPGPVSLLHWSGKEKPWDRLDEGRPCPVDHLWKPYDLYVPGSLVSEKSTTRTLQNID